MTLSTHQKGRGICALDKKLKHYADRQSSLDLDDGVKGQSKVKDFHSEEKARTELQHLTSEKVRKGYILKGGDPRVSLDKASGAMLSFARSVEMALLSLLSI